MKPSMTAAAAVAAAAEAAVHSIFALIHTNAQPWSSLMASALSSPPFSSSSSSTADAALFSEGLRRPS